MGTQLAKLGIINPKLTGTKTISYLAAEQFEFVEISVWIKEYIVTQMETV